MAFAVLIFSEGFDLNLISSCQGVKANELINLAQTQVDM